MDDIAESRAAIAETQTETESLQHAEAWRGERRSAPGAPDVHESRSASHARSRNGYQSVK